ncbi:conserved hypothetical protein [Brevibacillus brevis NBRC 100599]|uniref:DUF2515 domain-containing protein n=1 Tax=Brevibacillus brevis (strain 47 / JCM 6285 / NBRC 100599) TaxID=358681 RepID=C0ZEP7_BREBN|nr:DUF2515 family protein [Brevibacillus brevis]BAH44256.1 conserved hypothetical protein [Brevibacillus brevis NBRC 100599]
MTDTTVTEISEQHLVAHIRQATTKANRNNVTRTQAYLAFYLEHQEVHWALLAHLVSRNGGWNMTDLKGEWLPLIMDAQAIEPFFWFLERSNWLIFHDAYPQLLLYAEMKRTGTDLTKLLAPLGVSVFMQSYWQEFLATKDSARLTHALIVNEQQYIEQRVVQKPFTLNRIFSSFAFVAQSALSMNQVLIPYKAHSTDRRLSLIGLHVHHFPDIRNRIQIGKTLYQQLFGDSFRFEKMASYCSRIPHTGSRADYWPHLFTPHHTPSTKEDAYQLRLDGHELLEGSPKIYSPRLQDAWADYGHDPADGVDWFRDEKWHKVVNEPASLPSIDSDSYVRSLQWIEYGVKLVSAIM